MRQLMGAMTSSCCMIVMLSGQAHASATRSPSIRSMPIPGERADLEDAHAARILSDIAMVGAFWTLLTAGAACKGGGKLKSAMDQALAVQRNATIVMTKFDATQ